MYCGSFEIMSMYHHACVRLVLGIVMEVLDYTTDVLVFRIVAKAGLDKSETEPLVVPYMQ
jgi:hypothetical protein